MSKGKKKYVYLPIDYGMGFYTESPANDITHVFSSFKKARKFLKEEHEYEKNERNMHERLCIIRLEMNQEKFVQKQTIYAVDGQLLAKHSMDDKIPHDFERYEYEENFAVGDLVWIKPEIEAPASHFTYGTHGVVTWVPKKKEDWLKKGKKRSHWDGHYIIYYINDRGIADHAHQPECCLEAATPESIPEELEFLKLLSRQYKGEDLLSEGFMKSYMNDLIFLKKWKTFNFEEIDKN